ncbi:MAG: ABC transporter permease subunit [Chloroflexi bacterium]|nr:ABC transporter permease subunit [Chloroflexota bacterium]
MIASRECQALLRAPTGYVALVLALLGAGWLVDNQLEGARAAGLLVLDRPFQVPMFGAILITSVFLAVSAVVSVARERERGTLEVLFYGPVDEIAYVVGKLLGQMAAYVASVGVLLVAFLLLSLASGFILSATTLLGLLVSIGTAGEVVAFGLLLSVLAGRLRSAVLLFFGIATLFVSIAVAYSVALLVPVEGPTSPILPVRNALAAINALVSWISPFAYLERALSAAALGAWGGVATTLSEAMVYTLAALVAAAFILRRRGVRPREE